MMVVDLLIEKAFSMLFEELKDIKDKNVNFKPTLKKLRGTVIELQPLIGEIQALNGELDLPEKETSEFTLEMKNGAELVRKCLEVRWYNICAKSDYTEELLELDETLQRRIQILLVQAARDTKKSLLLLQRERAGVNGDRSNPAASLLSCHVPGLPQLIVGLDAPLKELKTRLLENDRQLLVVTASGGCGKTLLVQKFCHDDGVKGISIFFFFFLNCFQAMEFYCFSTIQLP